jgi:hypothetical protein
MGSDRSSFAGDVSTCVASKICDSEKSTAAVAPIFLRSTEPGVFVADVRGSMTRSPFARLLFPVMGVHGPNTADLLPFTVLSGVISWSLDGISARSAGWVSLATSLARSQKDIDLVESFESWSFGQPVTGDERTREGGARSRFRVGGLKRTAC